MNKINSNLLLHQNIQKIILPFQ